MGTGYKSLKDILNSAQASNKGIQEDIILYLCLETAQQIRIQLEKDPNFCAPSDLNSVFIDDEAQVLILNQKQKSDGHTVNHISQMILDLYTQVENKSSNALLDYANQCKENSDIELNAFIEKLKQIKKTDLVNPNVHKKTLKYLNELNIKKNSGSSDGNVISFDQAKQGVLLKKQSQYLKTQQLTKSILVFSFVAVCLNIIVQLKENQSKRAPASLHGISTYDFKARTMLDKNKLDDAENVLNQVDKDKRDSEWEKLIEEMAIKKIKQALKNKDRQNVKALIEDLQNQYSFLKQSTKINQIKEAN